MVHRCKIILSICLLLLFIALTSCTILVLISEKFGAIELLPESQADDLSNEEEITILITEEKTIIPITDLDSIPSADNIYPYEYSKFIVEKLDPWFEGANAPGGICSEDGEYQSFVLTNNVAQRPNHQLRQVCTQANIVSTLTRPVGREKQLQIVGKAKKRLKQAPFIKICTTVFVCQHFNIILHIIILGIFSTPYENNVTRVEIMETRDGLFFGKCTQWEFKDR